MLAPAELDAVQLLDRFFEFAQGQPVSGPRHVNQVLGAQAPPRILGDIQVCRHDVLMRLGIAAFRSGLCLSVRLRGCAVARALRQLRRTLVLRSGKQAAFLSAILARVRRFFTRRLLPRCIPF